MLDAIGEHSRCWDNWETNRGRVFRAPAAAGPRPAPFTACSTIRRSPPRRGQAPHTACTVERLREHPRVLCIQDTSELDYTGKTDIQNLGPLNYESRQGLYLHPTLAVTPDRLCLGVLDIHSWVREPGSLGQEKDSDRPLEEKESVRWVDGYQQVNDLAELLTKTRLT